MADGGGVQVRDWLGGDEGLWELSTSAGIQVSVVSRGHLGIVFDVQT